MKYPINAAGVKLLQDSEDFVGRAYPDPASPLGRALQKAGLWRSVVYKGQPIPEKFQGLSGKPWTNGWGFTEGIEPGDVITRAEGDAKLARLLCGYVDAIKRACKVEPNENQLAAMTVCAWNIGLGWDPDKPKPKGAKDGLRNSSIMRAHNREDFAAAARAFALWNKAGGEVIEALVTRRAAEAALYRKPVFEVITAEVGAEASEPMPQTVQPETNLLRSPIIQGTAATATTGITALANIAEQANTATAAWDTLSPLMRYWPYIAIAAVVIVAGAVIWHRWQQRREGWA